MPIKNPQDIAVVPNQPMQVPRTKGIPREEISMNFLNSIGKAASTVIDAQNVQDKKMISLVSARYRELADQHRITAEGEVAKTQGWNVLNVSKDQSKQLVTQLDDLKGKFDSKYEPYLENVRLDIINKYQRSSQPYVTSEVKKTTKATYNAIIANQMNDTILDAGNLDEYSNNLERVRTLVREKTEVERGEDPDAEIAPGITVGQLIDQETGAAVSKTVSNSIIQLAKFGHLTNAKDLFEKHDADMNADDRIRAQEAMKSSMSAEDDKSAIALADIVQKSATDMADAERRVSESSLSTKQRNMTMAILKQRDAVAKQVKKDRNEKTEATIYENLNNGKTLADVQDMMRTLPVKDQEKIVETINKNGGKVIPSTTNDLKFDEAVTRVYNDPKVLDNPAFLPSMIPHLSPQDHAFLTTQYNNRKRMTADQQSWNRLNSDKIILDDIKLFNNEMYVMDPSVISKNKRLGIEYAQGLMDSNPKMDQLELRKKVKAFMHVNAAIPKKKPREWYSKLWNKTPFGDGLDYEIDYNDTNSPDYVGKDGKTVTYSPEEMEAFREAGKKAFEKNKRPVDMQAVERAMRARMQSGKSLKVE